MNDELLVGRLYEEGEGGACFFTLYFRFLDYFSYWIGFEA